MLSLAKPWPHWGAVGTRWGRPAAVVALAGLVAPLAGCAPALETDQARLCRMALPALEDARIDILAQDENPDGRGVVVRYRSAQSDGDAKTEAKAHVAQCRFREPGRPLHSTDLVAISIDGEALGEAQLFVLTRYWLATPEGRSADPAPLGDLRRIPELPHALAYSLQLALDGLPLSAIYALLATAYSLIYGLIGRVNFAFGELAAAGRLRRGDRRRRGRRRRADAHSDRRARRRGLRRFDLGLRSRAVGVRRRSGARGASRCWSRPSAWRCSARSFCA